jgi:hypothetical protein
LRQIEQVARKSNSIPKDITWWDTPKASPANSLTSNTSASPSNSLTRTEQQVSLLFLFSSALSLFQSEIY